MTKAVPEQKRVGVIAALVMTGFGIGWLVGLSVSPVVSIVVTSVTGVAGGVVAALSGLKYEANSATEANKLHQSLGLRIDPIPVGLLVVGIFLGSILGILARNYSWLGSDLSSELIKWERAGLNKTEVARRLFELQYPYTPYARSKSLLDRDITAEYTRWITATTVITDTAALPLINEITKRLIELEYPPLTYMEALNKTSTTTNTQAFIRGTDLLGSGAQTTASADCTDLRGKRGEALLTQLNKTAWQALTGIVTDTTKLKAIVDEVLCKPES